MAVKEQDLVDMPLSYKDVEMLGGSIDSLGQSLLKRRMLEQQAAERESRDTENKVKMAQDESQFSRKLALDQSKRESRDTENKVKMAQDESQFSRKLALDQSKSDDLMMSREANLGQRESALQAKQEYQQQMMEVKQQLAEATDQNKRDAIGAGGVKATLAYLQKIEPEEANKKWGAFLDHAKQTPGGIEKLQEQFPVETSLGLAGVPVFEKKAIEPAKAPVIQPPHMSIIDKGDGERATNYYGLPITGQPIAPSSAGRKAVIKRPDGTTQSVNY